MVLAVWVYHPWTLKQDLTALISNQHFITPQKLRVYALASSRLKPVLLTHRLLTVGPALAGKTSVATTQTRGGANANYRVVNSRWLAMA